MKHRIYKNRITKKTFWYNIANVEDLVKIRQDIGNGQILNYKDVFGTRTEREGMQKAKDMFTDMMILMSDDLIYNNCAVVFPYMKFGYMSVGDIHAENMKDYEFDINTDGKEYGLKIMLDERIGRYNKKKFKAKFVRPLKNKVKELVIKGHSY